jgi:hypothetical protein
MVPAPWASGRAPGRSCSGSAVSARCEWLRRGARRQRRRRRRRPRSWTGSSSRRRSVAHVAQCALVLAMLRALVTMRRIGRACQAVCAPNGSPDTRTCAPSSGFSAMPSRREMELADVGVVDEGAALQRDVLCTKLAVDLDAGRRSRRGGRSRRGRSRCGGCGNERLQGRHGWRSEGDIDITRRRRGGRGGFVTTRESEQASGEDEGKYGASHARKTLVANRSIPGLRLLEAASRAPVKGG